MLTRSLDADDPVASFPRCDHLCGVTTDRRNVLATQGSALPSLGRHDVAYANSAPVLDEHCVLPIGINVQRHTEREQIVVQHLGREA
jgi:hypothetical protein